jgi:hypothetical protein
MDLIYQILFYVVMTVMLIHMRKSKYIYALLSVIVLTHVLEDCGEYDLGETIVGEIGAFLICTTLIFTAIYTKDWVLLLFGISMLAVHILQLPHFPSKII